MLVECTCLPGALDHGQLAMAVGRKVGRWDGGLILHVGSSLASLGDFGS